MNGRWFARLLALLALLLASLAAAAQGQVGFDHLTTGFALNGSHENVRCETCHIKGIFKGTPRDCATCHVQNNPRGAIAMGVRHIQTTQACDTCHSTTSFGSVRFNHVLVQGQDCGSCHNGVRAPGKSAGHIPTAVPCGSCHSTVAFQPVLRFDHSATNIGALNCAQCHDGKGATGKPGNHIPTLAAQRCETCHAASITGGFKSFAGGQMDHTGRASGCAQCHAPSVANSFFGVRIQSTTTTPPHLPTSDTCETCHTTVPTMLIPATGAAGVGGTTFAGGRFSHAGITGGCAQCHGDGVTAGTFIGVTPKTAAGLNPPHLPTTLSCESCHANAIPAQPIPAAGAASIGATTFAGGQMNHAGITGGCDACHGPGVTGSSFFGVTSIVAMPPTAPPGPGAHIPSSTACESCHLASTPAGIVPANAAKQPPGSGFATPAPTSAQIHAGVTSGCSNCHDTAMSWMGMSAYPISPKTITPGASYRGFQTRPVAGGGAFAVADAAHPAGGDCSQCHASTTGFEGEVKPANHIPYNPASSCATCHKGSDYRVVPTLADIHANAPSTTSNCAQCHGSAAASFAIPANGFSIVGLPGNHLPTTASCETCHVGTGSSVATLPVPDGARFTNSRMSHAGITTGCATCHAPAGTAVAFAGITSIVGMPATAPMGPTAHIPSGTTCESCHLGTLANVAGLVPANAVKTAPGTLFATPAPTGAQIHAGVTSGCSTCHETGSVWMGVSAYPIVPSTKTAGAQYKGFQTRPTAAAGTYAIADATHPSAGDCSQCHGNTAYFSAVDKPANHIPTSPTAQCTACHKSTDYGVVPSVTDIHANAPSTSGNCAQCHGSAAPGFAIPAIGFSIVGLPTNHIPTSASCEACHVGAGSSIAATPVVDGARFANSRMSHAGITNNCESCHVASGSATTFAGITSIVKMPPTSPAGPNAHIPSTTACANCHLGTLANVAGLIPANGTRSAPGTLFATPTPTGAQIHAGVTGGCSSCHEAGNVWMGVSAYPISPTVKTSGAQYTGFQTRPRAAAGTYNVADANHPGAGDCSQCHGNTSFFSGQDVPANHIPFAASAQCTACHKSTDYGVIPSIADIHANAQSTTTNCAQCHGSTAASFAIPSAGFSIVGLPTNHLPTAASCEVCHVGANSSVAATPVPNGAKFSNSRMSHAGITANCESCHVPASSATTFAGITSIVKMPPTSPAGPSSHIPSGTACASCHIGTLANVAGQIPANATRAAPGTLFATPAPTGAQIHAGVTSGCSSCHESSAVWMGVSAYPISPTVKTAGAQYTGFQTRPRAAAGTFNVADPAHPSTGDCSQCHSGTTFFSAIDKPANHIPYAATAQCTSCHKSTDYGVIPSIADIHAFAPSTTSNCAQCHGAAAASFAIPAANFSIVGLPSNHLPTGASCEVCHVGAGSSVTALPVPNGAKFANSRMSHAGITGNCSTCHVPFGTAANFVGVGAIVGMPPTSPMGPTAHIPSSTTCESCHLGTLANVSGLIPATATRTAPGSLFATPAPTTVQIHAGVTSGCSNCHEASSVWMGMSAYPISPTVKTAGAQYTGFQTRPRAAAGTFNVADAGHPAAGDCSQCHGNTNYFTGVDKPANHIPYAATAQCTSCHKNTDYAVMPSITDIHANAPSTTSNCAQCHGSAAASFAIPAVNFSIVGLPSNHLPTTQSCETCHVGTGSSIAATPVQNGARFANSRMSHAGITANCESCHLPSGSTTSFAGITSIVGMPPTSPAATSSHIPSGNACAGCHLGTLANVPGLIPANATKAAPGTLFATPAPTGAQIHAGVTGGCASCHEAGYVWMGVSAYPIAPTVKTAGAQYTGFQTRPRAAAGTFNVADAAHPSTGDCSQCHSGTTFFSAVDKPANHIPYATTAQCTSCHKSTDYAVMPSIADIHANAQSTSANCAQCHGSAAASFAIPSAGFSIVGLPSNHIPTTASCEVCHVGANSSVAATPVPNGAKFSNSRMSHAGITANCAACHQPASTATAFAGITSIVGMPPTSPAGASAHIPSGTVCESCHLGTLANVPGQIPANAAKAAPGSLFATPAPTTAQIHAGVTAGCSGCHEASYVWMGVSAYPISPTVKTAGAQYTGFQTRPRAAAGTFNVADPAHPSTGDCSQCHSGTNFFSAVDKPANHIPYATTAQCTSCHKSTDYAAMPTIADIHANAPSTTTNCSQCHGSAAASFAIPSANFSIVGLPGNHIPTTASCEVCHVGASSSIAALPVPNGAKFANSRMSHAGITNNCESCHVPSTSALTFAGITTIVKMPPTSPMGATSHIPSSTVCANCHAGTLANVSGQVPANATKTAPGTLFATPAPTGPQIHAGITSGCSTCHEASSVWMGMSLYPISPTTLTAGAQYKGFQTRPRSAAGTFNVADPAHPASGDCVQCHANTTFFSAVDKPANHIPYATAAQCTSCHKSTDYAVMPAIADIHANAPSTTTNCSQCHGSAAASFAIPSANFSIVGLPSNHIPTSASCEVCHVGTGSSIAALPVPNGAKFSGSRMSHSGITNNCVACHQPAGATTAFAGITSLVGMPPTSPMGASSHIPSSTTCETCHAGTLANVPGLVPANATKTAPGTLFATPAPTGPQIHTGITSGCSACHESGYVWMGMSAYPITPTTLVPGAQYKGFQTRPRATAGTYNVADAGHPTTGDCVTCHSSTVYFDAVAKPTGHIPTTQTCSTCHVVSGDYSIAGLTTNLATLHTGITSGCASCHSVGTGAGPFAGCATQATCASPPPLTYQPKAMPLDPAGSPTSPSKLTHVPVGTAACEKCHSPTVFTSFAGMNMKNNTNAHNAVSTATCITCHEGGPPAYTWYGVTNLVTRPVGHEGRKAGQDCISSGCHSRRFSSFGEEMMRPVLRSALVGATPRLIPGGGPVPVTPGAALRTFDHQGVLPAQCKTCHDGQSARGLPARHITTKASCDDCHRTTAWKPAAFSHLGVAAGQCATCHNGVQAAGKPGASHFLTARACDSCHRPTGWLPVSYSHLSAAYRPTADKPDCVNCHVTNGEMIPRQMHSNPRLRPVPVN